MTSKTVVVLGGYGIFGSRISETLAGTEGLRVVVAGRDPVRGRAAATRMGAGVVGFHRCDLRQAGSLRACLDETGAALLVHTVGPFQGTRYDVAEACLDAGVHYLDIADARDFVSGIGVLDERAKAKGLVVGSGASSVPTITYALVEEASKDLERIDSIQIALSPGNQNPRGASTIGAVLSYLGAAHRIWIDGRWTEREGWGDKRRLEFPPKVGERDVYAAEAPDLELFPDAWGAQTVRFHAGLELGVINGVLSLLRRLRSWKALPDLRGLAPLALRLSLLLYPLGSKNGALAVWVEGTGGRRKIAIVTDDDGPATPSSPAILLARKLLVGEGLSPGAYPCMGQLELEEILAHLEPYGIWCARGDADGRWSDPPPAGIRGTINSPTSA